MLSGLSATGAPLGVVELPDIVEERCHGERVTSAVLLCDMSSMTEVFGLCQQLPEVRSPAFPGEQA